MASGFSGRLHGMFGALLLHSGCTAAPHQAEPAVRWLAPSETKPYGAAPRARTRTLGIGPSGARDYALVLKDGDDAATALAEFARREGVGAARFTAVGAVSEIEVGWFDPEVKKYEARRWREQLEVLALTGDLGTAENGEPLVHAHLVVSRRDGSAWGGHLIHAVASPTLEVFITAWPQALPKRLDPETGLELFDLEPVPPQ